MSKKYKIKSDALVYYKQRPLTNENLTTEIAEYLLSTGKYNDIIEVIAPKKKKEDGDKE